MTCNEFILSFSFTKYLIQSCFDGERLEGGEGEGEGEGEGPGAGCLVTFCNCVVLLSCQTSRLTLHTTLHYYRDLRNTYSDTFRVSIIVDFWGS